MRCPSCSTEGADGAADCGSCGVNFAKWKAKADKAAFEAAALAEAALLTAPAGPTPPTSTLKVTLGVLGFLCAAVFAAYAVVHRQVEPPASGGVLVQPGAFRPRLQPIESAIYRAGPPTVADAQFISNEVTSLAGAVLERDAQNPFVRDAVGDLMEFAGAVAPPEDGALLPTARLDWARRWEVIRGRRFEKATWLHAAITPDDAPPPDFERAAARMQTAGHRLKTLMAEVPPELARFGKEDVNLADVKKLGAPAREKIELWRDWRTQWQSEVDQALLGFPKPEEIPAELQKVYDGLVRSAQQTRNPPSPGPGAAATAAEAAEVYLPGKESREKWVEDVTASLAELDDGINAARQAKAEAPKG
ncbi:hypothetical protein EPO15_16435 [bacterium]|nr:MAG: hypothetical protein EPO15_16435 [bacterium]